MWFLLQRISCCDSLSLVHTTRTPQANKGGDDRRDVLQLIFNHLDTARRGKISLCAIRYLGTPCDALHIFCNALRAHQFEPGPRWRCATFQDWYIELESTHTSILRYLVASFRKCAVCSRGGALSTTRPRLFRLFVCCCRGALSMVKLSEDPARHAHLSESIISCFCASDQPKSAGGAVDFTQFADVMACQVRICYRISTEYVMLLSLQLHCRFHLPMYGCVILLSGLPSCELSIL